MGFVARLFLSLTCERATILRQKIVDSFSFSLSLSFFLSSSSTQPNLFYHSAFPFLYPSSFAYLLVFSILLSEQYPEVSN